jgi:serine/threonine protein phosphatase 1
MAAKIIAIGDVHGCAEELKALIYKLPLDTETTLLFLGDYVDRGPDSKGVIDTVLDLSELYNVIALKGNHEWLMEEFLKKPGNSVASGNFILNGGSATLASYSNDGTTFSIPAAHKKFLAELRLYHETETHFFVHAGIPPNFKFTTEIDAKTAQQFLWIRDLFLKSKIKWPKVVVHGHTPVEKAEVLSNRVNLDTGCVFGRQLTAMNMATGQLFSVERDQVERPKFLKHTLQGGRPRAQRFEGRVSVEIMLDGVGFEFHTINFNEFGLLLSPEKSSEHITFTVGQMVQGLVNPGGDNIFRFDAMVMRIEKINRKPCYGLRFDKLESLFETF